MKYLIASDIHGSAYYCGLLKQRFLEEKPQKLITGREIPCRGSTAR